MDPIRLHETVTPGGTITRNMWVRLGSGEVRWLVTDIWQNGIGPVYVELQSENSFRMQAVTADRITERFPD